MKILIVGSRGFIGRHCVDYFSKHHDVWQCDLEIDYNSPRYFFVEQSNTGYHQLFQANAYDVCINCSGAANVSYSLTHPLEDFQLNTLNVFKLLDSIRRYNPGCHFVNLSSAAVYGNPISIPISENHILKPVSPYGEHKKISEALCLEFHKYYNLKTCSIRIFSAYGPGLRKQLFWDVYNKCISAGQIELSGTGKESRDFIYISDLVRLIDLVVSKSNFEGEVVNAANGVQVSIQKVVDEFISKLNRDIRVRFNGQQRLGDPLNWEADITKVISWGYTQEVEIVEGIKRYIEWVSEGR